MMSASLSMGKSAFVVIGLEEICHRLSTICRGPGQNIWNTTWPSCRSCDGGVRVCSGAWQSTQGPCRGGISILAFVRVTYNQQFLKVCRWSLRCVGSAGLYGFPILHYLQASGNHRKSFKCWIWIENSSPSQLPQQLWEREKELWRRHRDCDGGASQVPWAKSETNKRKSWLPVGT